MRTRGILIAIVCALTYLIALASGSHRPAHDLAAARRAVARAGQELAQRSGDPAATGLVDTIATRWAHTNSELPDPTVHERCRKALRQHLRALMTTHAPWPSIETTAVALRRVGAWHDLPQALRAAYRQAWLSQPIAPAGPLTLAVILLLLATGLTASLARMRRGPAPVDPQAETLENVEPIDIDTEAITLDDGITSDTPSGVSTGTRDLHPDLRAALEQNTRDDAAE